MHILVGGCEFGYLSVYLLNCVVCGLYVCSLFCVLFWLFVSWFLCLFLCFVLGFVVFIVCFRLVANRCVACIIN